MTKYVIYADGDNRPVKKLKRENEAINFITDMRNLAAYGYLTLVRESDSEDDAVWDNLAGAWRPAVDTEPQMEGYV